MVLKNSEEAIKADINARRLNHLGFKGINLDPATLNLGGNIAIA
jgi:hypothetical protein